MNKKIYRLKIFITFDCNLNCFGCTSQCGNIDKWYVNIEKLKKQLLIIKNSNIYNNIGIIQIFGGEPLLHPQWIEICELIHNIFPKEEIDIFSNGILLSTLSDENLIKIKEKYKVVFFLSSYPLLLNTISQQYARLYKLNIPVHDQGSRVFFNKTTLSKTPQLPPKKCIIRDGEEIYLSKGKLYGCYHGVILKDLIPEINDTNYSIDLQKIKNNFIDLNKLKGGINNACSYCCANEHNGSECYPWILSKDVENEPFLDLKNLYLYKYKSYEKIFNLNNYQLINFIKAEQCELTSEKEECVNHAEYYHFKKRYTEGKLDIYIPFDNNWINFNLNKIFSNILEQTFLNYCNFYFVSINTENQLEEKIYLTFEPFRNDTYPKFTSWFFKSNTEENGYKLFYKNSFSPYIYYLKDISLLENKEYLKKIYLNKIDIIERGNNV